MNSVESQLAQDRRQIFIWLLACCGMVFCMAIIGAITRLTESGLSIVYWKPIAGTLPPLSAAAWEESFRLYQQSPQYQQVFKGMSMDEFKFIYFWEWLHRLWGRLIGLVYALPLLWFWWRGAVARLGLQRQLLGLLLLGGFQGWLGWYMVQSGLIYEPAVSHYRLASHLGTALVIFSLLLWLALSLRARPNPLPPMLRHWATGLLGLVALTIIWGAFVAGLDAGLIYNEYPLMGGALVPHEMWHLSPAWLNLFENHAAVQFTHRWLAALTLLTGLSLLIYGWRLLPPLPAALLAAALLGQFMLGIMTLLSGVNIYLATMHQGGAIILLAAVIWLRHPGRQ